MDKKSALPLVMIATGILSAFGVAAYVRRDMVQDKDSVDASQPLYMTTMTHMESAYKDDVDEELFRRHAADIRRTAELFDDYGAKLDIESEQPFARANTIWNDNVLAWLVEHGHGVGTHADFGATGMKNEAIAIAAFKENKQLVDDLVGAEHNQGVSGGLGPYDWVQAAHDAGFAYSNGIVGFGYLAMPESARPDGWTDEYIRQNTYHDPAPVSLEDRIHPLFLANADDFVEDEGATFVALTGEFGELASLAEGRSNCFPRCEFNEDDIEAFVKMLDEAILLHKNHSDRVGHINVHIPMQLFTQKNAAMLEKFLIAVQEYVDRGDIVWGTQQEVYEAVMEARN